MKDRRHLERELHVQDRRAGRQGLRGRVASRSGCTSSSPDNILKSELVSKDGDHEGGRPGVQARHPAARASRCRTSATSSSSSRNEKRFTQKSVDFKLADITSEYKLTPTAGRQGHDPHVHADEQGQGAVAGRVAAEGRAARDVHPAGSDREQGAGPRQARRRARGLSRFVKVTAARFLGAAATPGGGPPPHGPEVAIAGRSNVGKSSLLNALLGRRGLARTSGTPGRTRQINFFLVNERFVVVDLPGYGFAVGPEAERRSWGPLVEALPARAADAARRRAPDRRPAWRSRTRRTQLLAVPRSRRAARGGGRDQARQARARRRRVRRSRPCARAGAARRSSASPRGRARDATPSGACCAGGSPRRNASPAACERWRRPAYGARASHDGPRRRHRHLRLRGRGPHRAPRRAGRARRTST